MKEFGEKLTKHNYTNGSSFLLTGLHGQPRQGIQIQQVFICHQQDCCYKSQKYFE